MKKTLAILLLLAMLLCTVACEKTPPKTSEEASSPESSSAAASTVEDEAQPIFKYGTYYLKTADGRFVTASTTNTKISLTDGSNESACRWTVYYQTVKGAKHYMIYRGEDAEQPITAKSSSAGSAVDRGSSKKPTNYNVFNLVPNEDGSAYQIVLDFLDGQRCISANEKGELVLGETADKAAGDFFRIEKAAPSDKYEEFISEKGNIVLRIPPYFTTRSSIGFTKELAQKYTDLFQLAYEAEVELTGFVPYDVVVIRAYLDPADVAGAAYVTNGSNYITTSYSFMQGEVQNFVYRYKTLKRWDLGFAMMHELGHMFDFDRAWNFESEAWTDLKLCYAVKRCNELWQSEEGYPVGLAPSDFGKKDVFVYEELDEMYTRCGHYDKGAMSTNYSFYATAHYFLKVALETGWEPFIKTFHDFQEAGQTQSSYKTATERYLAFVSKLDENTGRSTEEMFKTFTVNGKTYPKAFDIIVDFYTNGGQPL